MNKYIGTKLVEAEKATLAEAQALKTGACDTIEEARRRFGVLRNGFEIIETSTCVDAQLGEEICMKKIKDKIWYLLGFLLQTAWHGIK